MLLFLYPQIVEAIEIHEIRWGFGDRPVAYKINPVTILVENTESQPFESEIRLQRETFRGQQIGIALSTTTYIAPFEKKWVQFYPYLTESADNWKISWKHGTEQRVQSFLSPRATASAVMVQLIQPDSLSKVIPGIKQYPEDLFPPILGAVDPLSVVFLDHLPKWEKSRRITFLQWIYSGGIVHIFENPNGELPVFPESFSPLNVSNTTSPVQYGAGIIHFYRKNLAEVPPLELKQLIINNIHSVDYLRTHELEKNDFPQLPNPSSPPSPENSTINSIASDEDILVALTEMSTSKQIWYFIFLISFIYLLVAGPGYFLVTKFSNNHYTFYGFYLGSTMLFCLIFLIIGQYSASRTSQIHSLIIANLLPDKEFDITEWSSLGIASGGNFKISHSGDSHIYTTCQDYSKVNGTATSGSEGNMLVDIPTNSSRSFLHRGNIPESTFGVSVNSFLSNDMGLEVLSLETDKHFPQQVDQVHFLFGSKLYELEQEGHRLEFQGTSRNLSSVLGTNALLDPYYLAPTGALPFSRPKDQKGVASLKHLFPILLQRALKLTSLDDSRKLHYPESQGKLFILSAIPDGLFLQTPVISRKEGLVLYCLEIPLTRQAD
tara:strand:- start:112754 stop:114571 length:1818 start_codon:yes stop_codon:yes gene_type:complete